MCLNYQSGDSFDYVVQSGEVPGGELQSAGIESACRNGLALCMKDVTLDQSNPECRTLEVVTSPEHCDAERVCTVPVALDGDLQW